MARSQLPGRFIPRNYTRLVQSFPSGRPRFLHELMHLVAYEVWGRPHEPHQWISEGLATFSPGRCAEFTLASLAALMADTGELPSLDTLVNRFYSVSDVYTYLAGASFVEYVHRTVRSLSRPCALE